MVSLKTCTAKALKKCQVGNQVLITSVTLMQD